MHNETKTNTELPQAMGITLTNRSTTTGPQSLLYYTLLFICLFVCFVALRPKSTAMVIAGRSVHLTTLFPGQA